MCCVLACDGVSATGVRQQRGVRGAAAAGTALALLCGCAGSPGQPPNSAGSAAVVPGAAPTLGAGGQGGITVTGTTIARTGQQLAITARIHNAGSQPDALQQIGSQVTATLTLKPPLEIPAGATRELGTAGTRPVLRQNGRLVPGGTVDLMLTFRGAGTVQVFSSFQ
jgi:hypothetical protein